MNFLRFPSQSFRTQACILSAVAWLGGCRGTQPLQPPGPGSAATSVVAPAPPSARIVLHQVRTRELSDWSDLRILTPSHTWEVLGGRGVTIFDSQQGAAIAGLATTPHPLEVALSPDRRDLYVLLWDGRPTHSGKLDPGKDSGLWDSGRLTLERWDWASGTRRFRRDLPEPEGSSASRAYAYHARVNHLAISQRGVVLTRCFHKAGPTSSCIATNVAPEDGALGPENRFEVADLPTSLGQERVEHPEGRFSISRGEGAGQNDRWWIFDAGGRIPGQFEAKCARFDATGTLWVAGANEQTLRSPRDLGLQVQLDAEGERACGHPRAGSRVSNEPILGLATVTFDEDQLRFKEWGTGTPTFALSLNRSALPQAAELPPEAQPRDGFIFHGLGGRLFGEWLGSDDSKFHLSLAVDGGSGAFRPIRALSDFNPTFAFAKDEKTVFIAGGHYGLQRVDIKTGAVVSRRCGESATPRDGRCPKDSFTGLVPTSDGRRAFTHHEQVDERLMHTQWFEEIDLESGRVLSRIPTAMRHYDSGTDYKLGWLEQDKSLFYAAGSQGCSITTVKLDGPTPQFGEGCIAGRSQNVGADPDRHLLAVYRAPLTVDLFTSDGEWVASVGDHSGSGFALGRDGRFACRDAACDALRCVVDGQARSATDAACAELRQPGIVIDELLRK